MKKSLGGFCIVSEDTRQRAISVLHGVALGDAFGNMAVGYEPEEIINSYSHELVDFEEPIPAPGRTRWGIYEVTDDTIQTLAIARVLAKHGKITQRAVADALLSLDSRYAKPDSAVGRFKESGLLEYIASNEEKGSGAAMRVASIGIAYCPETQKLVKGTLDASIMTHGSSESLAGACAIAVGIASALSGWDGSRVIDNMERVAGTLCSSMGNQIARGRILIAKYTGFELRKAIEQEIGCGFTAIEAVPAAITLALSFRNAEHAITSAAMLGGDSDTIGSITGALSSALFPRTLPARWVSAVLQRNNLIDLDDLALSLLQIRARGDL